MINDFCFEVLTFFFWYRSRSWSGVQISFKDVISIILEKDAMSKAVCLTPAVKVFWSKGMNQLFHDRRITVPSQFLLV